MSALSDKIKDVKDKDVQRIYSEEYRQAIWKLLIAFGGVHVTDQTEYQYDYQRQQAEWNYYGGRPELSLAATKSLLLEDKWDQIDWEQLDDPAQHMGTEFNGTFASGMLYVPYLRGVLKFLDGTEYVFMCKVEGDDRESFSQLLRALQLDITIDEAVENLQERTEIWHGIAVDEWNFAYSAVINI